VIVPTISGVKCAAAILLLRVSRIDEPRCAWKNNDLASLHGRTNGDELCDCDDDNDNDDDDCGGGGGGVYFSRSFGDENSACSIRNMLFNNGDVCITDPHDGDRCWNLGLSNDTVVVDVATVRRHSSCRRRDSSCRR